MKSDWPYEDAKNTAAISTKPVFQGGLPILWIFHDEDDGSWQFMCGTTTETSEAMVVALERVVKLDPTVMEVADLPLGWMAWRDSPKDAWKRAPNVQPPEAGESAE